MIDNLKPVIRFLSFVFMFNSFVQGNALNDRLYQLSIEEASHLYYIDIYTSMLDKQGEPNPKLFVSDRLHLSPQGYDLWEEEIRSQTSVFRPAFQEVMKDTLEIPPFIEKSERLPQYPLKTKRMIYDDDDLAEAWSAIEHHPIAQEVKKEIIKAADQWISWEDEDLRDLLTNARVPRAFDLNAQGCPEHGDEIFNFGGHYPWVVDPALPFKVKCPIGGEFYPSNDYERYYQSDFKEKKDWDTDYVDDGWGWIAPDGERYWFVAYANHWIWFKHINPAILNLSRAYLLTGDRRYAHKAAVMLYRLAQVYPEMDYANQSRYGLMSNAENRTYNGKVVNLIWETGFIQNAAEAYDGVWDSIDDDLALQKLYGKNGREIRGFIEANLLEEALDAYFEEKIRGNYGMHQMSLLYVLLARQNMDTEKYIHQLVEEPGQDLSHAGIRYALYNSIFRDGQALESPGYNMVWVGRLAALSELLKKGGVDLFQNSRLKMLLESPLDMVAIGKYTVDWGDTGSALGGVIGRDVNIYQVAYEAYQDLRYLEWLASINQTGEGSYSSFESLFRKPLPETQTLPNGRAVAAQPSRLLAGYGLGILNNKVDETAIALTYGMHVAHYHWDFLNIELFANGQKMMPDLGYPDAMNAYVPEVYAWSKNTINHNTVVVDAKRQNRNLPGILHDFTDGGFARTMDASSPAYTQTADYRRNVTMVDVENDQSYVVDFFRVAGGKQHSYSLHGPPGEVSTIEGVWGKEKPGTFAGTDVSLGSFYDHPKLGKKGYKGSYVDYDGSGFQYLFNVQPFESGKSIIQYKHTQDLNARLRIHLLEVEPQEIYIADAFDKPRAKDHIIKYLIAQRKSDDEQEEFKSTFVSVLEPYNQVNYIQSTQLIDLAKGDGIAVEVSRADVKDLIINDTENSIKKLNQYPIETDANSAVITLDYNGKLKRVFFSNGTYLSFKGQKFTAKPITGSVVAVDVNKREIKIKIDDENDGFPIDIPKTVAYFKNEYQRVAHALLSMEKSGSDLKMVTSDDLLTGLARIKDTKENIASTSTHLPFSLLYKGSTMLNENMIPVGKIQSVQEGRITLKEKPLLAIYKDSDVWFSSVGVGDEVRINSVFSWEGK